MIKEHSRRKLTFIDLFAGCGGLSEGFLASGHFEGLAHIEWEKPMVETLRHRLTSFWNHTTEDALRRVIHFDVQQTDALINGTDDGSFSGYGKNNHPDITRHGLNGLIGDQQVDLIIGGPPCQAYSIAGRAQDKDSMRHDYRNYLFESFVKIVDKFKPSAFVFENVPGLLTACPGDIPVTERIFSAFRKIGYRIREPEKLCNSLYTASHFGVPQKRKRVIIIGTSMDGGPDLDKIHETLDSIANPECEETVRTAIGHLPRFSPLAEKISRKGANVSHIQTDLLPVNFHTPRYHNSRDIEIFRDWINQKMNRKPSEEKIAFYNDRIGKNSKHGKYRNLEWNKPSPTIVSHLYKDGLMFIHPDREQARSITVKEAALLQSFPNGYEFIGSMGHCFKMIGNAVPPKMATCIAEAVYANLHTVEVME